MEELGGEQRGGAGGDGGFPATLAHQAAVAVTDGVGLAVLASSGTVLLWRSSGAPEPLLACVLACILFFLSWSIAAPASWQRCRVPALAALRLALAAPLARLLGRTYVAALGPQGWPGGGAPFFLFTLFIQSGTAALALCAIGLQLPPVLGAALQAAAAAMVAANNPALCSTTYMQHPGTQARLDAAYLWLEPAIAPLAPLLWAVGLQADNPRRRCYCVLAALQFWCGLVLPTLAAWAAEQGAYRPYRFARLRAALLRQRRELRSEHRRWTRAAAAARRAAAGDAGIPLSDLGSSPSSGPSSPESAEEVEAAGVLAAGLMDGPAPPGALARADWQWELVHRALGALRGLAGWSSLPVAAAVGLLYAWHLVTFGEQ